MAGKAEAISAAVKAGKPPPVFEPEDVLDPAYNLPYRPGQIIPPEPVFVNAKEVPKEKADVLVQESMKQYETWVAEEEKEFKHHLLPTVYDWQMEDTGVGSVMAQMQPNIPVNRQYPRNEMRDSELAKETLGKNENNVQLGIETGIPPVPDLCGASLNPSSALVTLDFATETEEQMQSYFERHRPK